MQTGRERFPPRTWPLWLFWFGLLLGALFWAFGVAGVVIGAVVIAFIALAVANDWLG